MDYTATKPDLTSVVHILKPDLVKEKKKLSIPPDVFFLSPFVFFFFSSQLP